MNLTWILATLFVIQSVVFFVVLNKKQPNYDTLTNYYRFSIIFGFLGIPSSFCQIIIGGYFLLSGIILFTECSIYQSIAIKKDEGYIE